jgi:hypothetical protein
MPLPAVAAPAQAAAARPIPPERPSFSALLDARSPLPATSPPGPRPGPALSVLEGVERAQARLDAVLAAARAGRTFTAAELIGLQAEAYRCAQTVDLASKLVEQGAQALKQALNTQL